MNCLPHRYAKIGRWWGKVTNKKQTYETEIDIMAVDQKEEHYLLGECKFKGTAFDMSDYHTLEQKWMDGTGKDCCFYLFSQSGFTDAVKELESKGFVVCISLEDVVKEMTDVQ